MNEGLIVVVRGIIGFFSLLIFARILGKQQISQLTFFDYILGITIGSIAASLTTDLSSRAWPHWVGLFTWTLACLGFQIVTLKWRKASKYIDGEATIVIMNGKIMEEAMRTLRYRAEDLLEQLRIQGAFDISQVEFAVVEKNGQLSVLKKSQYQPITPSDMNLPTSYAGIGTELIYNGVIIDQNLKNVNLDNNWLAAELKKQGISDPAEVFLAILETSGDLYVDTYKDRLQHITDISDYKNQIKE